MMPRQWFWIEKSGRRVSPWLVGLALMAAGCDGAGIAEMSDVGDPDAVLEESEGLEEQGEQADAGSVDETTDDVTDPEDADVSVTDDRPVFVVCDQAPLPADPESTEDWERLSTEILMTFGPEPHHVAQAALVTDAVAPLVNGKFRYGPLLKDLEGERVELWMDDCSGDYVFVADAWTDSHGKVQFDLSGTLPRDFGRFALFLRVAGDHSIALSELVVYPEGTTIMISDIDGTLTRDDGELFQSLASEVFGDLAGGDYVPELRDGAREMLEIRAAQGYPLVYLSGRPDWLHDLTRDWLQVQGLPVGVPHVIDGTADVLPTESAVGEFKRSYLEGLLDMGFVIDGAYGNATTDIYAYGLAPVDTARTWIVGPEGGHDNTQAVGDDYHAHNVDASSEPNVMQPFQLQP